MNKQREVEPSASPSTEKETPFERFAELARRIVRVPKAEIPKEKWSKTHPPTHEGR